MIEKLRRYWIALLVLVLVGLHASIIAIIRMQAMSAKTSVSCEIDLGEFSIRQDATNAIHLRVHAVVPAAHRLQAKAAFEQREWEVRQNVEESLRQFDPKLLQNPYLDDLKVQVLDVLIQTLGEAMVEKILITQLSPDEGAHLVFHKAPKRRYDQDLGEDGEHGSHDAHGSHNEHGSHESHRGSGHDEPASSDGDDEEHLQSESHEDPSAQRPTRNAQASEEAHEEDATEPSETEAASSGH